MFEDRYLFGAFGREADMCAIAALSLLDKAPRADIRVTLDALGAERWGATLASNAVGVGVWTPGDPPPAPVAELIEREGLPALPQPTGDIYATPESLDAACTAYFLLRMLELHLRGGARLDADTLTFSDPTAWFDRRSPDEFLVSAYTRSQACCGIVCCRAGHPLLLDWYRRKARRPRTCEEPIFNNARLKRWRGRWPMRMLHFTTPTIFDVRDRSATRGRRRRVFRPQAIWDPNTRLGAPVLHYAHSGQDSRVPGSPPYRYMTVADILGFPLDGDGDGNIVVGRAKEIVDRFGLAEMGFPQ